MQTDFEILIEELENEAELLREELQELLYEKDFKYAQYYQKGISLIERKIRILKKLERPGKLDGQTFYENIADLNEDRIRSFSLISQKGSDFYLHFYKSSDRTLFCEIPSERQMLNANYYGYRTANRKNITSLGFHVGEDKSGIEFNADSDTYCTEILTKLAILMFDILQVPGDICYALQRKK